MLRSAGLFSQLLELFPRHQFARLVKKHRCFASLGIGQSWNGIREAVQPRRTDANERREAHTAAVHAGGEGRGRDEEAIVSFNGEWDVP